MMSPSTPSSTPATEASGRADTFIDALSTAALLETLLDHQANAISAVRAALPAIERAVEWIVPVLQRPRGRIVYCGAGTSGRIALLDAAELIPTFGWDEDRIEVLLAGGKQSLFRAQENAEDDGDAAYAAARDIRIGPDDVLIGLSASGTTPYVLAAIEVAQNAGAITIGMANNDGSPVLARVDLPILLSTGPEALAGSTRLTAGTSQKISLNLLSTAVMVRLGRVYQGRMVSMRANNAKLRERAVRMVVEIAGIDADRAQSLLEAGRFDVKTAILMHHGLSLGEARQRLAAADGELGRALSALPSATRRSDASTVPR